MAGLNGCVSGGYSKHMQDVSVFSKEVLEGAIALLQPFAKLDTAPNEEELVSVPSKLKSGKAEGKTSILPELVRCGGI